jgi:hypothetical protein
MTDRPIMQTKTKSLKGRYWLTTLVIVAAAVGYRVYSETMGPRFDDGLKKIETDLKSKLPIRVNENTTLIDVKYERTNNIYWYLIDNASIFDAQQASQQIQTQVCSNAEMRRTIEQKSLSYEYHYKSNQGVDLADFKISKCS